MRENFRNDSNFGIVEMGGASTQITFPCADCEDTQQILVRGESLPMYSYSFLGLGQDEAPKTLGLAPTCEYGVGLHDRDWTPATCAKDIHFEYPEGFIDPYNYGPQGRGTYNDVPNEQAKVENWTLTGAFNYMAPDDVDNCCMDENQCYQPETSCFRAVYLPKYLNALEIVSSQTVSASWTYGAAVCAATNCLQDRSGRHCRWTDKGCLE